MTAYLVLPTSLCDPLDREHTRLMYSVIRAHQNAARNNANASTGAVLNAMHGSGRLENALASGLLAIGGPHAPLAMARFVFEHADEAWIDAQIRSGARIPGFGNSFYRGEIDPAWGEVAALVELDFPDAHRRIEVLLRFVRKHVPKIYPNAALFTAIAASECRFRRGTEAVIFLLARLPVWADLAVPDDSERRAAKADDGTHNEGVRVDA